MRDLERRDVPVQPKVERTPDSPKTAAPTRSTKGETCRTSWLVVLGRRCARRRVSRDLPPMAACRGGRRHRTGSGVTRRPATIRSISGNRCSIVGDLRRFSLAVPVMDIEDGRARGGEADDRGPRWSQGTTSIRGRRADFQAVSKPSQNLVDSPELRSRSRLRIRRRHRVRGSSVGAPRPHSLRMSWVFARRFWSCNRVWKQSPRS